MKQLPEKFIKNNDFVGKCEFTQVKQQGNTYLYRRTKLKGHTEWFEVFNAKTIRKGAMLPNGTVELEDRIQYPGSEAFGRTAYCCKNLTAAEQKFLELIAKAPSAEEIEMDMPKKRGRKSTQFVLQLPEIGKEFTIKELVDLNQQNQGVVYLRLQDKIKEGIVIRAGTKHFSNRGKPTIVYKTVK